MLKIMKLYNAQVNKMKLAILVLCSMLIYCLVYYSTNNAIKSDAVGTLLTAQSIIENQTIKLDAYQLEDGYSTYQIHKKNNHSYYFFPLGSSLSSIPFVYIGIKYFNLNMSKTADDNLLQTIISSLTVSILFIVLFIISNNYLSYSLSLFSALIFIFGTSLSSTLGQALWSHNFAILYSAIALLVSIKIIKDNKTHLWPLLSLVLFAAYLSRPTFLLFSITILLFFYIKNYKLMTFYMTLLFTFFLFLFILFSLSEYDQVLPDYYMPKRLSSDTFLVAFYGNLLSPSRGLLVFSPLLLLFFLEIKRFYNLLLKDKALLVFIGLVIVHLIIISKFPIWWGGHSYGSRLTADLIIPIYFLWIILLADIIKSNSDLKKSTKIFLTITIFFSIYIHSYQGLYNKYSQMWNVNPSVDIYNSYLFDWDYPQFFYNSTNHEKRIKKFNSLRKNHLPISSSKINYVSGWYKAENLHIWSKGNTSIFSLFLEDKNYKGILSMDVIILKKQTIKVYLNDVYINTINLNSSELIKINFNEKILKLNQHNLFKFEYSNPHQAGGIYDNIAMALVSFKIE